MAGKHTYIIEGKTRGVERGRRFKGTTDAGVIRPHETKGASTYKRPRKR